MIYGGEPTLICKKELSDKVAEVSPTTPVQKIAKYSWNDEDAKVKIYIELN